MKRFAVFLGGLLALPAFAEVAPVFYDDVDVIEYNDADYVDDADLTAGEDENSAVVTKPQTKISRQVNVQRNGTGRGTAMRTTNSVASATARVTASGGNNRAVSARNAVANSGRNTANERGAISRAATRRAVSGGRGTVARTNSGAAVRGNTVARSGTTGGANVSRAATNSITYVGDSGTTLYNANTAARVGVRSNASVSRAPVVRVASGGTTTSGTTTVTSTSEMDELTELTDYCKAQYAACMDNYCNILDDSQGRCICSSNLNKYAKAEEALKNATEELRDVAEKIKYLGLSTRDTESLFEQTEAELAMQSKSDTSQIKTSLDKIKNMVINVQSGGASSSASSVSFDLSGLLDFSIDGSGFDLTNMFGSSSTSNVSNQRGTELYKTATARCKENVLKSCTAQGVDASIITNAYDLEIDKECIIYERSLNDSNDQLVATIRNAKSVLQQARYMVAKQKNEYDMRQCINELDKCMQDDFVCGDGYENCIDPTGAYIVNGAIVVGSQPGNPATFDSVSDVPLYRTWDFKSTSGNTSVIHNAWGSDGTLNDYIANTVTDTSAKTSSDSISEYLQNKIGYVDGDKNNGMCVSVLNKCQDYTYSGTASNLSYDPKNEVVKQYLARVLVQIKARQDEIVADYAEDCTTDVASCLNQNNYPTSVTSTLSPKEKVAVNACNAVITTCMSVNGYKSTDISNATKKHCWVRGIQFEDESCSLSGSDQNVSGGHTDI